jgi:hypothetical protein
MTLDNINFATSLALLGWPIVALWLYRTRPIGQATVLTILGGFLLLPMGAIIKFEMIPAFDKESIPSLVAFLACIIVRRRAIRFSNGLGLVELLILTFLISPIITSLLNYDPIVFEGFVLPGLGLYDAGSTIISRLVVLIPFFLGRQFLRSTVDNENILRMLVAAGLIYSLPMLFEVRMSPQLNTWIYGYFPTSFGQQFRYGGFRPVVFLGHGLYTAFFAMTTVVAAAALWRAQSRILRFMPAGVVGYLGIVLAFCKSAGPIVYGAFLVPLVRWATPRMQLRVATVLVVFALAYPTLRAMDLVPTKLMLEVSESVSAERAESLRERFSNEYQLLERASQRFWFGWGRFGRSRIRDEYGSFNSTALAPPDGYWIITMGQFGFVGFLATFGLLGLSVFRAASALRFAESKRDRNFFAALALIVAVYIVNLLPNSDIFSWTWLLVGALLGRAEALRAVAGQPVRFPNAGQRIGSPAS